MSAPYADIYERDESNYISSNQSVNTYIASWAPCGPVGTNLVVNSKTFYKNYTPDNQYKSGYPTAFLEAEALFNINEPVYFNRVVPEDALYGGAVVCLGASNLSHSLATGIASPASYIFAEPTGQQTKEKISVLCKADDNSSLGATYFYLPGKKEYVYIKTNAQAEKAVIICSADASASLKGTYFILPGQQHYVWFEVDSQGTDPGTISFILSGKTGHKASISSNDVANTVATAVATALSGVTGFTTTASGASVEILATTAGAMAHGNAGTSGFSYTTSQLGLNASDDVVISGLTSYAATISANATAAAVATAINTAMSTSTTFDCSIDENNSALLLIESKTNGFKEDAADGEKPTTFVLTTVTQGSNEYGSEVLLFYSSDPNARNIAFKLYSHQDHPEKAPDAGTFLVEVYLDGVLETSIICSRDANAKDGLGNPLYVEQAMLASAYLRCRDNIAIDSDEIPASITTAIKIGGGTPGTNVTTADMIKAVKPWYNKDDFDITLMLVAGFTDPAYIRELDNIAKTRGDAVTINSIPYAIENASDYLASITNYRKNDLNINSSYTATFSSQLEVFNSGLNKNVYIPSDGYIAGAIVNASRNYEIFYPILGFKRGILNNVLDVKHRYTREEMDALYDIQINPIRYVPGRGIVIWGQKTMQSTSSTLDRLNARLLLCSIKPQLQQFIEDNIGELNSDTTRDKVTLTLNGLFDLIKAKDGITDYKVSCDPVDPNNPNKLVITVKLAITPAIEFVELTIVLTPAGVTIS